MGFWKKASEGAGKVAKASVNYMKTQGEVAQRYVDRYETYDDERLMKKLKETHGIERAAVMKVLNDRGYGN